MSHTMKVKGVECKNPELLARACEALGLTLGARGQIKLWQQAKVTGQPVMLPGWTYPAVFNTEDGTVAFDNHNGHWGNEIELDKLVQQYSVEVAKHEAMMLGYSVEQETLANGDIKYAMVQY